MNVVKTSEAKDARRVARFERALVKSDGSTLRNWSSTLVEQTFTKEMALKNLKDDRKPAADACVVGIGRLGLASAPRSERRAFQSSVVTSTKTTYTVPQ